MSNNLRQSEGSKAARRAFVALAVFVTLVAAIFYLSPDDLYNWGKAVHVIAVMSWMAGMLYLPRLFIYHTEAEAGSVQSETFKIMERRLMKIIMTPAMLISWVLGIWLAIELNVWAEPWFILKFVSVIAMSATHMFFASSIKAFANDQNQRSARQWRMINEVPTVLMIAIVIFVIVRPFS